MRKELVQKEGYVIRLSPYKEADQMVTAFGKEGIFSFLARGIRKLTSKNASSCRILSYSKFSLSASLDNKSLTLTESATLSNVEEKEDLLWMSCLSFLAEINSRLVLEDDAARIFPSFDKTMKLINSGYPITSACLLYFARLINELGYGLEVDGCVSCLNKHDIVGISYEEGGYICSNCADGSTLHLGSRYLKILRYIFRFPLSDFGRVSFEKEECLELIKQLSNYLEELTGVKLKSVSMLEIC